jgi:hypothetical protein
MPRNKPPQYSSHLGSGSACSKARTRLSRWRCSTAPRSRRCAPPPQAVWQRGCWRARMRAIWLCSGPGSRRSSHLRGHAGRAVRCAACSCLGAGRSAKAAAFAIAEDPLATASLVESSATVREAVAGADIICTRDQGARAHTARRVAGSAGVAPERCGLEHRRRGGNRHGGGGEGAVLRRLARFDRPRGGRVPAGPASKQAITPEHILGEIGEVANGCKAWPSIGELI